MTRTSSTTLILMSVLAFTFVSCDHNKLQRLAEDVRTAEAGIAVQLQRRADLVPKLIAAVEGGLQHQAAMIAALNESRTRLAEAVASGDIGRMAEARASLDQGLVHLLLLAEAEPSLRAGESFVTLLDQIEGSENRVAVARNRYNQAVSAYNRAISTFPTVFTAKAFDRTRPYPYFGAEPQVAGTPPGSAPVGGPAARPSSP